MKLLSACWVPITVLLFAPTVYPQDAQAPTAETAALDEVVVTATLLGQGPFEQAQPVTKLAGEAMRLRLQPTLGETLAATPGVSSSYFGPAASRPVIRGLDGDRIRILQNGSNTIDASATSVDHAVSFDTLSIESIEIVRGPATLLYGSNAIGGVVNVIDRRIPEERIDTPVRGTIESRYGSNNSERAGAFTLEGGVRGFAWHVEGYKRATDELRIPGYARSQRLRRREPLEEGEKEPKDVLPNSDLRTEGLSGGASYIWDQGFIGASYSRFHTNYGTVAERNVTIDMEQRRFDVRGAFFAPLPGVESVKYSANYSDYEHTEFEGSLIGTRFENEGYDSRLKITHNPLGPWHGTLGLQAEKSSFSALGEEAFLPAVETQSHSAFLFEELTFNDQWRLQLGTRFDHTEVASQRSEGFGPARGRAFDNVSGSSGLVFTPSDAYAVALNVAFTQRAPTYQELFANGPHLATNAFEIGDAELDSEQAVSVDLSLRKRLGRVTGAVSLFYNRFSDFIGQFGSGESIAGEEDELPIFEYRATDAEFYGGEAELTFHLLEPASAPDAALAKSGSNEGKTSAFLSAKPSRRALDLELKADYVHAEDLRTNKPLPRIPPFRASAGLNYTWGDFRAGVEAQYSARQNRISDFELATDSFVLVNASLAYGIPLGSRAVDVYVRGVNLTNEEARVHTSFLKDIAPLGGRGVLVGLKVSF